MDQKFIDERMHYLNLFMKKLSTIEHLWYSDESQLFLRGNGDIEKVHPLIINSNCLPSKNLQQGTLYTNMNKYSRSFLEKR
jgi:hypothetical protein